MMSPATDIERVLTGVFGFQTFRPGQHEIIEAVLSGRDVLGVLPTGAGKSLCYQLPALLSDAVTLVISPLIALMHDQVASLAERGIPATEITAALGTDEIAYRLRAAQRRLIRLLYVAPERLDNASFIEELRRIPVERIVVDEAHCISQWGHDFRPAYLRIGELNQALGRRQMLALTATATPQVREDILVQLGMREPYVYVGDFDRPNLEFIVGECPQSRGYDQKAARIADHISRIDEGATIIYAGTRKATESIAALLGSFGFTARAYHAGMPDAKRHTIQQWFTSECSPVLVATVAFGMGIDKADVRAVFHCDLPLSLESYYQEAGRAGRDGRQARCVLLYSHGDERLQRRLLESQFPPRELVEDAYALIGDMLRVGVGATSNAVLTIDPTALAHRLRCSVQRLDAALDFLERQRLISRRSGGGVLRLRLVTSYERWREYCMHAPPDRAPAIEALLRSIQPTAFERAVEISLDELAQQHSVTPDELRRALSAMELARIAEVMPIAQHSGIRLVSIRYARGRLPIEWDAIEQRRQHAAEKVLAVVEYVRSSRCKRAILLEYFGQNAAGQCDRCSSCRRTSEPTPTARLQRSAYEQWIRSVLLSVVAEFDGLLRRTTAVAIAIGKADDVAVALGATRSSRFGELSGVNVGVVRQYLDRLLLEGKIIEHARLRTLRLSTTGCDEIGKSPVVSSARDRKRSAETLLDRSVVETLSLVREGLSPAQVAERRSLSLVTVVNHLVQAIAAGVDVPRRQLLDESVYAETLKFVRSYPRALLRDLHAYFGGRYDYPLLRLAIALARSDLARSRFE
jgi:ATP-dependent DNA helicase RecQ